MNLLKILLIASVCIFDSVIHYGDAQEFSSKLETYESINDGRLRYPNYTECGGIVDVKLDQLVVIEYKLNEEYNNNEMCVWTLRNNEAYTMLITKISSGFEVEHDFLQVTFIPRGVSDQPNANYLMGNTTGIEQRLGMYEMAFLIFSTDSSNTGTGFRVEIAARSVRSLKYWEDDFFTTSPIGSHSVRPYYADTMTSWVIAPNAPEINLLELRVDYSTEDYWDEVIVFQLERNGGRINFRFLDRLSDVGSGCYTIQYYTTYVVIFVSNSRTTNDGEGVTLSWTGSNSHSISETCTDKMKV